MSLGVDVTLQLLLCVFTLLLANNLSHGGDDVQFMNRSSSIINDERGAGQHMLEKKQIFQVALVLCQPHQHLQNLACEDEKQLDGHHIQGEKKGSNVFDLNFHGANVHDSNYHDANVHDLNCLQFKS
ncbi:hypothetical protein HELRODRAFT_171317 [Helobdella robusta]|uniref:Uncharacterized protein n=1 Tax=Helobdella robusta TaxID=6412 RepID=T1F436_HELRO|nr:hypothetical protein HELRODRAFT_171317 [Helobdella robusta]ESO05659.1 hypothetical protein HELRODRAFT_171317 [Helobdella robusta]